MLFESRFHAPIASGQITTTVRIWHRPRVKIGGRYALGGGAIVVERIFETDMEALTAALAKRCGFSSLVDLIKTAKHGAGQRVFVIDFHYEDAPARPKVDTSANAVAVEHAIATLDAMDRRAARPWTRDALRLIAGNPGVRAGDLAAELKRPRDDFKTDVRKLKALGLTISLEVGYRITERGRAVLRGS